MQLAFYFDQSRCTGCHTCVVACKDWHDLPAGPVSRRRVMTYEEGRFPDVKVSHVSLSCNHCLTPKCAEVCPEGAIGKHEKYGVVLFDEGKCTTCRVCEGACLYGAIQFGNDADAKAEKCDFCLDRLEKGEDPICVAACPMRALDFAPYDELSQKAGATVGIRYLPNSAKTTAALFVRVKEEQSVEQLS